MHLCTRAFRGTLGAGGDPDLYAVAGVGRGLGFLEMCDTGFGLRLRQAGRGKLGFGGLGFEGLTQESGDVRSVEGEVCGTVLADE